MLGTNKSRISSGSHVLAWMLGQADVWYLLYRCAHYVSKTHNGEEGNTNVSILNNFFSLEEEEQENTQYQSNEQNNNNDGLSIFLFKLPPTSVTFKSSINSGASTKHSNNQLNSFKKLAICKL